MAENVKISLGLFNQTIDFLESFDTQSFDPIFARYHRFLLASFLAKRQRLDLRNAYAKIVFARDEDERFDARMNYLYEKGNIPE